MPVTPVDLAGKKILITGPTGQVALPVVEHFARIADVYALARFRKAEDRDAMESMGATVLQADLADAASLAVVPEDFDYVLNFAVVKSGDFDYDLAANAEGVGNLMTRCRNVKAFLHFSSTAVYEYGGQEPARGKCAAGRQPPRHVSHLQHFQDCGRDRVPLCRSPAPHSHHHCPPERALWRQWRLDVLPSADDAAGHSH